MQKGQTLIFIILAIVAAGFLGVMFYAGKQTPNPPTQVVTSTSPRFAGEAGPSPTPSPSPNVSPAPTGAGETANWKTYTNNQYKFSFKYPSYINLKIKDNTDRFTLILEDTKTAFILDVETANNYQYQNSHKTVKINNITWNASFSADCSNSKQMGTNIYLTECPQIIPYYQTTKNNFVYSFTFGLYEEKLADILKTFKFLK